MWSNYFAYFMREGKLIISFKMFFYGELQTYKIMKVLEFTTEVKNFLTLGQPYNPYTFSCGVLGPAQTR